MSNESSTVVLTPPRKQTNQGCRPGAGSSSMDASGGCSSKGSQPPAPVAAAAAAARMPAVAAVAAAKTVCSPAEARLEDESQSGCAVVGLHVLNHLPLKRVQLQQGQRMVS